MIRAEPVSSGTGKITKKEAVTTQAREMETFPPVDCAVYDVTSFRIKGRKALVALPMKLMTRKDVHLRQKPTLLVPLARKRNPAPRRR